MKTCVDCGCDLPTPLDEFGDIDEERCEHCHLEYLWNDRKSPAELAMEDAIYDAKRELKKARKRFKDAKIYLRRLKCERRDIRQIESKSIKDAVTAWINGEKINDRTNP
jgi:hypothetical protein